MVRNASSKLNSSNNKNNDECLCQDVCAETKTTFYKNICESMTKAQVGIKFVLIWRRGKDPTQGLGSNSDIG
jgi:hypothetical protein